MSEIAELERRLAAALDRLGGAHGQVRASVQAAHTRIAALEAELEAAPGAEAGDSAETAELRAALEKAQAEIARLEDQLSTERESQAALTRQAAEDRDALEAARTEISALRARDRLEVVQNGVMDEAAQERVAQLESSLQRLQKTAGQLRLNNAALRQALAEGVPDADLIGEGMKAELASLEAARAADRAEIDSILAALKPIVEETADA